MSSIYATFHSSQSLIYALHNTEKAKPLSKLGNGHKEALRTLEKIFSKASLPAIPLRVPVSEIAQEKPKEINQERAQIKSVYQATPSANAEPLRNLLHMHTQIKSNQ